MPKYKIVMQYPDGTNEEQDEIFDTEEDAEEYALYLVSCSVEGSEILNLSNPGDYPLGNYEESNFEIIQICN